MYSEEHYETADCNFCIFGIDWLHTRLLVQLSIHSRNNLYRTCTKLCVFVHNRLLRIPRKYYWRVHVFSCSHHVHVGNLPYKNQVPKLDPVPAPAPYKTRLRVFVCQFSYPHLNHRLCSFGSIRENFVSDTMFPWLTYEDFESPHKT